MLERGVNLVGLGLVCFLTLIAAHHACIIRPYWHAADILSLQLAVCSSWKC